MKPRNFLPVLALLLALSPRPFALADTGHQSHVNVPGSKSGSTEQGQSSSTFAHQEVVEGVRAEFQVMSLASMNMKDPKGNTHHIMVKLFNADSDTQIKNATGEIRLISPSGKERQEMLTNYNGILAASFTFDEKGKYRVNCLFEVDGKKREVNFSYPNG